MAELRAEVQEIVDKIKNAKLVPFEVFYLRSLLKPPAGAGPRSIKKVPAKKTAPAKKTVRAAKKATAAVDE